MKKSNFGVIGLGRFGVNYLKTLDNFDNADVISICSRTEKSIKKAEKIIHTSKIKETTDYKDILNDPNIDAVAIVTPGSTHKKIVKEFLEADKHVIVEKPLAFKTKDVEEIIKKAEKINKVLVVSDIHSFNPGIIKLSQDIKSGLFGKVNYARHVHCGNGPVRDDMNALWDFFPHATSIFLNLFDDFPVSVSAAGSSYIKKDIEDVVTLNLKFKDNGLAIAFASWLHPLKKMRLTVVGERKYATFDDYAEKDKLRYYKDDSYVAPKINDSKPLAEQLKYFLNCIEQRKSASFNNQKILKIMKILESAQHSLKNSSKVVKLSK